MSQLKYNSQEKQEQLKRQAEQQAMMHRREAGVGVPPERMMGPRPGMPPPGMVPRMEGPARYIVKGCLGLPLTFC